MSMELATAQRMAAEIVLALEPFADKIEIAGSIRRARPYVNDIDLVAIPRMTSKWSMFAPGDVTETDFADALRELIVPEDFGQKILRGPTRVRFAGSSAPVSVDIYIATPENWATLLLIRTGSAEHNIWLCSRAKACGGKLHADGSGLEVPGQYDQFSSGFVSTNPEGPVLQRCVNRHIVRAKEEEEIFSALGIPAQPPEKRECWTSGRPVWMTRKEGDAA